MPDAIDSFASSFFFFPRPATFSRGREVPRGAAAGGARLMRERFGANARASVLRFHTQTLASRSPRSTITNVFV